NQSGDEPGRLDHPLRFFGAQSDRWIDRKRVTGMDPGPLDMLQDARDQYRLAIADGIHIELAAQEVLVDEARTANAKRNGCIAVSAQLLSPMNDLHPTHAHHVPHANPHPL